MQICNKSKRIYKRSFGDTGENEIMNQEHWSIEQYKEYQKKGNKRSKYGAIKTSVDGQTFDSVKEANYYNDLKLKLKANEIKGFCLQPIFILAPGLKYKADFIVFYNDGSTEIIDAKGFRTKEYIAKKKVFEDKYDLKIKEI